MGREEQLFTMTRDRFKALERNQQLIQKENMKANGDILMSLTAFMDDQKKLGEKQDKKIATMNNKVMGHVWQLRIMTAVITIIAGAVFGFEKVIAIAQASGLIP